MMILGEEKIPLDGAGWRRVVHGIWHDERLQSPWGVVVVGKTWCMRTVDFLEMDTGILSQKEWFEDRSRVTCPECESAMALWLENARAGVARVPET